MFKNFLIKIVCFLLKKSNLSLEQKNILSTSILDVLNALPLKESLALNEQGELELNGKVVDADKAIQLKESANVALGNLANILIAEQVNYEAIVNGVHRFNGDSGQLFMRAALWWEQERKKKLESLAGRE
jgi:hypothetical protein